MGRGVQVSREFQPTGQIRLGFPGFPQKASEPPPGTIGRAPSRGAFSQAAQLGFKRGQILRLEPPDEKALKLGKQEQLIGTA